MTKNKKYNNTISFPLSSELQHCQQNKINRRSYVGSNTDVNRTFTSLGRLNSEDNRKINFLDIKPIVRYNNADVDKVEILADNRNKLGVYR